MRTGVGWMAGGRVRGVRWLGVLAVLAAAGVWVTQAQAYAQQKTLPFTGLDGPVGVAVAGGGVYVADTDNNRVEALEPSLGGSFTQETLAFDPPALSRPQGVAVTGADDVFVADSVDDRVLELPAPPAVPLPVTLSSSGLNSPEALAVDASDDVFAADTGNDRVVELPAGGAPQITLPFSRLSNPQGVAVDAAGDVFTTDTGHNRVLELPAGGGPQIMLPFSGLDDPTGLAVDPAGDIFVTDTGNDRVVELPVGGGSQATLPFSGLKAPDGVTLDAAGDVFVTDTGNNRVVELPVLEQPSIAWAEPAAITYPTPLSSTQLDATASVPGTFTYAPTAGTVLHPGIDQLLSATFTPTDTTAYSSVTEEVEIDVKQATPSLRWATPAKITYGTALSGKQLNATASVPGSFAYTPSAGTVLGAGTGRTLSVRFTPRDSTDYNDANASVRVTVLKAPTELTVPGLSFGSVTATLTRSDTHAAIKGEKVVFSALGTTVCSATTNSAGTATCNPGFPGILLAFLFGYQANFAGDADYVSTSATAGG